MIPLKTIKSYSLWLFYLISEDSIIILRTFANGPSYFYIVKLFYQIPLLIEYGMWVSNEYRYIIAFEIYDFWFIKSSNLIESSNS